MSFITSLFRHKKHSESAVLIDISADSVAGAYAHYIEGDISTLLYALRLPVEARENEPREQAMLRAFNILGAELLREGAPILLRATGSGRSDAIIVSIDAPWQETRMRSEHFERKNPFAFTESMVITALKETSVVPPKKILADECIIGTVLNGYETLSPYGKMAHSASVIVLTSFVDTHVAEGIAVAVKNLYHTKKIRFIAGSSLRYQAMCKAFPHEHDALILDAIGPLTSIALVHKNLFSALAEVPATAAVNSWMRAVMDKFSELAGQYPLPRTIFLLANESSVPNLRQALSSANFSPLWLSDNPPKIIPVLASHFTGLVRQATSSSPDLRLLLMALYHNKMI